MAQWTQILHHHHPQPNTKRNRDTTMKTKYHTFKCPACNNNELLITTITSTATRLIIKQKDHVSYPNTGPNTSTTTTYSCTHCNWTTTQQDTLLANTHPFTPPKPDSTQG